VVGYADLLPDPGSTHGNDHCLTGKPKQLGLRRTATTRSRPVWVTNGSDELLRLAIRVGGIGIYETDLERGRTRFSPELCAMLGLPVGTEMASERAWQFFDQRDVAAVKANVEAAQNGQWSGVYRFVRTDGTVRWASIHGRRHYRDTSDRRLAVRSLGTVVDITPLKETEEALRQSELRLRLALEAAQMGTFEADIGATEAVIDAQEARLLGLPEETRIVGADELRVRVPLEDLRESDAKKERLQQHNESYLHEFRLRMPDGSERWLSAHAAIRANRIFGVTFDVTQRKHAEAALRESEARLRIAVSGAALGVFEWDPVTDQAIWENDRMYEIFGQTRRDGPLSQQQFIEHSVDPDHAVVYQAALKDAMQTAGNFHAVCRIRQKGGSQRWIQIEGKFQRNATDDRLRLIGVVADITERKTLEQEAEDLSDRLLTLQEEERQKIAQELHDSTAQHLVAASLNLMNLRSKLEQGPEELELWDDVEGSINEALKELRTISYLMHPPVLQAAGLGATIRQYIDGYADRSQLAVKFRSNPKAEKLPFRIQRVLFRIVQEALANVHRHAAAKHVSVDLRWIMNRLHLTITDDGRGVSGTSRRGEAALVRAGVGIRSIRARVRQLGGNLKIRSGPLGTSIHAAVPVK
jgi:PAS domain S-box-containing protein